MANATLKEFLAGDYLTKLAAAYNNKPGVPRVLPAPAYTPIDNPNVGTEVSYDLWTASREAAPISNSNSVPMALDGDVGENKKAVAIGSRAKYVIDQEMIEAFKAGGLLANNARTELSRQLGSFVQKFQTLDTDMVHAAWFKGAINIGSDGIIQVTAISPKRVVDFGGTRLENQLTIDGAGDTFNIGDWSNAATDIVSRISALKQFAAANYGFNITHVYYGKNVPGYLAKNTIFKEYLKLNPQFNTNYVSTGEIPNGVLGLTWVPVSAATKIKGGTATAWVSDDFLMFSPDPADDSWYQFIQCGLLAPNGMVSQVELTQAMLGEAAENAFAIKYGLHSYSLVNMETLQTEMITANFKLPLVKSINAVYRGVCK